MTATDDLPNLLSIDQLAEHLGTSTRHIRRLVAERRVPYLKVGHFVRFDPAEIATWLDCSRMGTPATLARPGRPTMRRRPSGLTVGRRDPERGVVTEQRRYADHRPYPEPPRRLADLTGPATGVVELPITIDWGPKRRYDLGTDADRRILYERVRQEAADTEQVAQYVNGSAVASPPGPSAVGGALPRARPPHERRGRPIDRGRAATSRPASEDPVDERPPPGEQLLYRVSEVR